MLFCKKCKNATRFNEVAEMQFTYDDFDGQVGVPIKSYIVSAKGQSQSPRGFSGTSSSDKERRLITWKRSKHCQMKEQ